MKERIVITQDWLVKDMKAGMPELDKLFICQKVEQVPETFEELKKLCRNFEGVKFFYDTVAGVEYININDTIAFNENGLMLAMKNNFDVLVKKRTPAQMYQIIKNLIGEE